MDDHLTTPAPEQERNSTGANGPAERGRVEDCVAPSLSTQDAADVMGSLTVHHRAIAAELLDKKSPSHARTPAQKCRGAARCAPSRQDLSSNDSFFSFAERPPSIS